MLFLVNLVLRLSNEKIVDFNRYNYVEHFNEEFQIFIGQNLIFLNKAIINLKNYDFIGAAAQLHLLLLNLNTLVHKVEFWKDKENKVKLSNLGCTVFEFVRIISILFKPFLPELMVNLHKYIGLNQNDMKLKNCKFRIKQLTEDKINKLNSKEISEILDFDFEEKTYFDLKRDYKNTIFVQKKN